MMERFEHSFQNHRSSSAAVHLVYFAKLKVTHYHCLAIREGGIGGWIPQDLALLEGLQQIAKCHVMPSPITGIIAQHSYWDNTCM